jgi:hypothetical protein
MSLSLPQIAALLQATPQTLRSELTSLPGDIQRWRPAPDEWCINEVLGHLIEADRHGFDGRIRAMLAADQPALEAWDISGTAAQRRDCERDGFELLAELTAMREQSAQLITSLQPDQLARTGLHPVVGELVVGDLLYEWVHHDRNHLKQILSNVQAFVWPSLGSAQKFFG